MIAEIRGKAPHGSGVFGIGGHGLNEVACELIAAGEPDDFASPAIARVLLGVAVGQSVGRCDLSKCDYRGGEQKQQAKSPISLPAARR